jgi:hypothetical protein
MLFVLQNTADESLAEFMSKNASRPVVVMVSKRIVEVEVEDEDAEDLEDAIEHAGFVVLDRQEAPKAKKAVTSPAGQGFGRPKAESSTRRSPDESPWLKPRDPWG